MNEQTAGRETRVEMCLMSVSADTDAGIDDAICRLRVAYEILSLINQNMDHGLMLELYSFTVARPMWGWDLCALPVQVDDTGPAQGQDGYISHGAILVFEACPLYDY